MTWRTDNFYVATLCRISDMIKGNINYRGEYGKKEEIKETEKQM
jgi:hypothetical protein